MQANPSSKMAVGSVGLTSLEFVGQSYLPVAPRSMLLTSCSSSDGQDQASTLTHVAAVSADPCTSKPEAYIRFVEWSEQPSSSSPSGATMAHVVKVSERANVTSMCDLVYGAEHPHQQLCFPVSLSDDTVVLVCRVVDDDDGAVSYRMLGTVLRTVGSWTACCVVQRGPTGGRIAATHVDGSMSLIDVQNERLEYVARLAPLSDGLTSFPMTQLDLLQHASSSASAAGSGGVTLEQGEVFAVEMLALCHTVVLRLRCAVTTQQRHTLSSAPVNYPGAKPGSITVVGAYRWTPLDPLEVFAICGGTLYAGTSDGTIAMWQLYDESSRTSSPAAAMPVGQFLCDLPPSTTGSAPPARRRASAVAALVVRQENALVAGTSDGIVSLWSSSVVWREQGVSPASSSFSGVALFPASSDEVAGARPSSYGYPPICGLASTHRYMTAVDGSGMLTVWRWLQ
jgi:hypothetical protein